MNKQTETFTFNPPLSLAEGGKWLMGVTSSECTNSAFNLANENKSFLITTSGHWNSGSAEKTIDELNYFLKDRS